MNTPKYGDAARTTDTVALHLASYPHYVFVTPQENTQVRLGKAGLVDVAAVVGAPYGSVFQVKGRRLERVHELPVTEIVADTQLDDIAGDNRNLRDDNSAQTLSQDEIERMKNDDNTDRSKIVAALVQASSSFQSKTQFSQEKYIKKKQSKYLIYAKLERPSPRNVGEYLFAKKPEKLRHMRGDTLAQLLGQANAHSGARVMVVDTVVGLVVGSVLWRLGGRGRLFSIGVSRHDNTLQALFGFPKEPTNIVHFPAHLIPKLDSPPSLPSDTENIDEPLLRRMQEEREMLLDVQCGCDSLVIAADYDILEVLEHLVPHVNGGGAIVIQSGTLDELQDAYMFLKRRGLAVNLEIRETWTRYHQVLPGRTHPNMSMHGASSYLLHGVKASVYDSNKRVKNE